MVDIHPTYTKGPIFMSNSERSGQLTFTVVSDDELDSIIGGGPTGQNPVHASAVGAYSLIYSQSGVLKPTLPTPHYVDSLLP